MKALVTGAAGFIGSHLCDRLLDLGADVVGVDNLSPFYAPDIKVRNLERACSDSRFGFMLATLGKDVIHASGITHVFHLAGQPGVRGSWSDFASYRAANIDATFALLEWCQSQPQIERIVLASTSAVYGDRAPLPFLEDGPTHPVSPYGVTKRAAEDLGAMFHEVHGLPIVTLRYFSVYGPRQRPDMAFSILIEKALTGESFTMLGDGTNTRDYTYVDDIVRGTLAAADRGTPGRTYNLGGGSDLELREVIRTIENVLGRRITVQACPIGRGEMRDTWADISRAGDELNWRPQTSCAGGIAAQITWALEHRRVAA